LVGLAGDRPVVTFWCDDGPPTTVVYDADGSSLQVAGSMLRAAHGHHVLLSDVREKESGAGGTYDASAGGTYLLDVAEPSVKLIEDASRVPDVDLAAGLALWTERGDTEHRRDVIWHVGRLP
jgi:hypothetical protein